MAMYSSQEKCRLVASVDLTISTLLLTLSFVMLITVLINGSNIDGFTKTKESLTWALPIGLELVSIFFACMLLRSSYKDNSEIQDPWNRLGISCYVWGTGIRIIFLLFFITAYIILLGHKYLFAVFALLNIAMRFMFIGVVFRFVVEQREEEEERTPLQT